MKKLPTPKNKTCPLFYLFRRNVNCKSIYKMPIAIELLVGPLLKQHPEKHIMFQIKVTSIGCHNFAERRATVSDGNNNNKENSSLPMHENPE